MIKPFEKEINTAEWTPGMARFMEEMNRKAAKLEMTSSFFANPYGGCAFGWNTVNCLDMLKLGLYAWSYPALMDVMTNRRGVTTHVYGPHERDVFIKRDYQAIHQDAYEHIHEPGTKSPHIIYGGKGGGWGSGDHKVFAYLAYGRTEGKNVMTVVSNTTAPRAIGRTYRQWATAEAMDVCAAIIRGEDPSKLSIKYAEHAAAILLPESTPGVVVRNHGFEPIFTQDAETCFNPASMSKVLMAVTAMDICGGIHEVYRIEEYDICNDSDYIAFPGDVERMADGLYPTLVNSNGSNTLAMARHCGEILLEREKQFPGLFKIPEPTDNTKFWWLT